MEDKVGLLMGETGCDRGTAELALESSGYEVEGAIRAIPRLLRNIAVLKGRFRHDAQHQVGQLLVVLNFKTKDLLRTRAVISYNPQVYSAPLEKGWFEFEQHLFACRLWEGSVQAQSQELERRISEAVAGWPPALFDAMGSDDPRAGATEMQALLGAFFHCSDTALQLKKDILDLGQFQSLRSEPAAAPPRGRRPVSTVHRTHRGPRPARPGDPLILKISLAGDPEGLRADELRAGDMAWAVIDDPRDIAQYLGRLLGGQAPEGSAPVGAPVEAIESGPGGLLIRLRLAAGVCGDATAAPEAKLKAARRRAQAPPEGSDSWWKRIFRK